jgi:putative DNA primase/helicase
VCARDRSLRTGRQDFFRFTPTFKLLISGNHKPRLYNVDEAMRRRLLLVPFTVQIPGKERDPQLPEKLKAEWPAILRWVVDGCLEWQRAGLAPPKVVLDATEAYFADQDTLGQWLGECTEEGDPATFARTMELFASWKTWAEARNHRPGSEKAFSESLVERGYEKERNTSTGRMGFRGLIVKA